MKTILIGFESLASRYMDWMREAEDDLGTAKYLLDGKRYSKACFHAQQAAEKAVGALLIRRCGMYEDVHSVVSLLQITKESVEVTDELVAAGNRLDRQCIPRVIRTLGPRGLLMSVTAKEMQR